MAVGPQNVQNRKRIGIVVGLIIAGLGLGGALLYVNRQGQTSSAPVETKSVMVTTAAIPPETKLDSSNTAEVQRPVADVPVSAFAHPADVLGLYASIALGPNEVVTSGNTVASPLATATHITLPPLEIPDNFVAMAIPDDATRGVGGYIQAGDHIDFVIQDGQGLVRYFLQDVKVLRLGQASQQTGAATTTVDLMIVALPRDQAASLSYLLQARSATLLRYVLRPRDQYSPETVLKQDVTADATTVLVQHNASLYPACDACGTIAVQVGTEQMQVTQVTIGSKGKTGVVDPTVDVWTVTRGANSTTATGHTSNAAVYGAAQYLPSGVSTSPKFPDHPIGPSQFDALFTG